MNKHQYFETTSRATGLHRSLLLGLSTAISLLAPLVWASPARAAVAGVELVITTGTKTGSENNKNAAARCPLDPLGRRKKLLGIAGSTAADAGGADKVVVQNVIPNANREEVLVEAFEVPTAGFAGNWTVTAYAICKEDPQNQVQIVTSVKPKNFDAQKSATATCPLGLQSYGVGFAVQDGVGDVFVHRAELLSGRQTTVQAITDNNSVPAKAWGLTTYAVCALQTGNSSLISRVSLSDPSDSKSISTGSCPTGRKVHGLGFGLGSATTPAQRANIILRQLTTTFALSQVSARVVENDPVSTNWDVFALARCDD
jgi:hypothetical protein